MIFDWPRLGPAGLLTLEKKMGGVKAQEKGGKEKEEKEKKKKRKEIPQSDSLSLVSSNDRRCHVSIFQKYTVVSFRWG